MASDSQPEVEPVVRGAMQDLTTGSIPRHIVTLAIPSALTNLLQFSYHFVDMMWLGRLGPSAIAVTATYHFFFMVFVFFNQIVGLGSITLISRTFGAKDEDGCRRYIGQTFSFKLVIALIVMALGLTLQRWMWTAFGSADDVIELGLQYTTVMFSVIPIYLSAFTLRTALSSIGDMKTLLKISAISTVANLVLDPFLIFDTVYIGPFPALGIDAPLWEIPAAGLGVRGAAWASFSAIAMMFLMGLWYFTSGRTFIRISLSQFFTWDWRTVWRVLKIGTPPAFGENLHSIAQIIVGRIINTYGTAVFAASGIMGTAFGLVFIPVGGLGQAVATLVGQNLGANKPERAEKSVYAAFGMTVVVLVLMLAAAGIWTEGLMRLFLPGSDAASQETVLWAVRFLRVALIMMLGVGIGMIFGSAFWGSGDTKPPMYVTVATTYGIQIPITLIGALVLRLENPMFILWAWVISALINASAMWVIFKLGRWKTVQI
ncbi:MATE family efflux transporter [bacterium]|nr:MATE family efflux transporter [bacterium]